MPSFPQPSDFNVRDQVLGGTWANERPGWATGTTKDELVRQAMGAAASSPAPSAAGPVSMAPGAPNSAAKYNPYANAAPGAIATTLNLTADPNSNKPAADELLTGDELAGMFGGGAAAQDNSAAATSSSSATAPKPKADDSPLPLILAAIAAYFLFD